ncbi:hypothetical protein EDD22DRAFT_915960 [Suillus occidentalis]|nr:hypothetical protein EDD22DRAFT_915960 [Suillus occidentalis]
MSKKKAKVAQTADVSTSRNCASCNRDINTGLGGEANWKARTESLEHRKNISAVKNTPILTSFFQPKKVTRMQTAVVAGPTQAWQPVTGADEATVARVATVTRPSAARVASLQARNDVLHVSHIVHGSDSQHKDLQDEYCWCRGPESGEMQCSFSSCNQWFHFECVGLLDAPEADWFCSNMCSSGGISSHMNKE